MGSGSISCHQHDFEISPPFPAFACVGDPSFVPFLRGSSALFSSFFKKKPFVLFAPFCGYFVCFQGGSRFYLRLSVTFRFVAEGDGKPVPRIDTHHGEVEIDELLFGENSGGFRIDFIGQMMLRD